MKTLRRVVRFTKQPKARRSGWLFTLECGHVVLRPGSVKGRTTPPNPPKQLHCKECEKTNARTY